MTKKRTFYDEQGLLEFCNEVGPKNIISIAWKPASGVWVVFYIDPLNTPHISKEAIKQAYKEFDDMYEEAEIPPYDTAYNYFEAGVRYAEKTLRS